MPLNFIRIVHLLIAVLGLTQYSQSQSCIAAIYRPFTKSGGSIRLGVIADGIKVANLRGGESSTITLDCGKHIFSLTHFEGIRLPIVLEQNSIVYLRAERPWGFVTSANLDTVSQERATAEMDFSSAKH